MYPPRDSVHGGIRRGLMLPCGQRGRRAERVSTPKWGRERDSRRSAASPLAQWNVFVLQVRRRASGFHDLRQHTDRKRERGEEEEEGEREREWMRCTACSRDVGVEATGGGVWDGKERGGGLSSWERGTGTYGRGRGLGWVDSPEEDVEEGDTPCGAGCTDGLRRVPTGASATISRAKPRSDG